MEKFKKLDCNGRILSIGNKVILESAPEELLAGLPDEDQKVIKSQVGNTLEINDFDKYGHAEIEFTDDQGVFHTVWLKPVYLRKQE